MKRSRLIATMALVAAPLGSAVSQATVDTGSVAPNFTAPGANMSGVIPSVSLAAYKGKTVVLAFFYKARTKG
jgi:ribosomal protein L11